MLDLETSNFNEASDGEILDLLKKVGIKTTLKEFNNEARKAGTPSDLTDKWFEKYNLTDEFVFPLYDAIVELWKRHLDDMKCPELLADELDDIIDSSGDDDRETLLQTYTQLRDFYHKFIKEDGAPDSDLFCELYKHSYNDIEGFLQQVPYDFENNGLIDEAVNLGRWFSRLSAMPQYHLKGVAYILAKAGRIEEALRQIDENMENFPEDFGTTLSAGDAMSLLEEEELTERYYLEGPQLADGNREQIAACERLIDFYSEKGDAEKTGIWKKRHESLVNESGERLLRKAEPVVRGPKIGRNEPCPCGSGKKYKKCCLDKEAIH